MEVNTWQVYYLEEGKHVRQLLSVQAEFLYEAYALAEKELRTKNVVFLAVVRSPLKLQSGERE